VGASQSSILFYFIYLFIGNKSLWLVYHKKRFWNFEHPPPSKSLHSQTRIWKLSTFIGYCSPLVASTWIFMLFVEILKISRLLFFQRVNSFMMENQQYFEIFKEYCTFQHEN